MTTKNKDSLKGILKDIEQERRAESAAASKLKMDNRKAFQDLEDKGFNRVIITPNLEPDPVPETVTIPIPKKKVEVVEIPPKEKEIIELKKKLATLEAKPEVAEEPL